MNNLKEKEPYYSCNKKTDAGYLQEGVDYE